MWYKPKDEMWFVQNAGNPDAGTGLKGVKVKGGGDSCTTKASGRCTLTIKAGKPGKVSLKATANGYGFAKETLKVKE